MRPRIAIWGCVRPSVGRSVNPWVTRFFSRPPRSDLCRVYGLVFHQKGLSAWDRRNLSTWGGKARQSLSESLSKVISVRAHVCAYLRVCICACERERVCTCICLCACVSCAYICPCSWESFSLSFIVLPLYAVMVSKWMNECMNAWMRECVIGWMNGLMNEWMNQWLDEWINV